MDRQCDQRPPRDESPRMQNSVTELSTSHHASALMAAVVAVPGTLRRACRCAVDAVGRWCRRRSVVSCRQEASCVVGHRGRRTAADRTTQHHDIGVDVDRSSSRACLVSFSPRWLSVVVFGHLSLVAHAQLACRASHHLRRGRPWSVVRPWCCPPLVATAGVEWPSLQVAHPSGNCVLRALKRKKGRCYGGVVCGVFSCLQSRV
jgi:hypothetical protein